MELRIAGLTPLVQVFDMNEALHFYEDLLGFEIIQHSPLIDAPEGQYFHWAWLRLGGADLMLNTAYDAGERPIQPDMARIAAHGDTCFYFGCSDVGAVHAALAAKGLPLEPPSIAPYGMKQLALCDPDGYRLCFQERVGTVG